MPSLSTGTLALSISYLPSGRSAFYQEWVVWILSSKLRPVVAIALWVYDEAMSVKLFQAPSVSSLYGSAWIISVASAVQMVADMMITSTLIYLLRRHRTGFRRSNSILDTLIAYVLSTASSASLM
ncbi:hypothetical protein BD310DRAFT_907304 [Dichomitus squalens]|uniref:DUF6534 domain-containing protein n=1 Tax=Dichomitus squalens TaxID=114155 RepID=A0A4Q9PS24_9APHY|nr:hypothetical protein BD310DRAFT_907304 [Dichomitus squalens]